MTDILEVLESATEMAKFFGYQLDYSMTSIFSLDEIAHTLHKMHTDLPMPETALNNAASMIGICLGETMLRNGMKDLGFAWVEDEDGQIALGREDDRMYPVAKAYKRIVYGPGDDLISFCMVSLALAGAGLP